MENRFYSVCGVFLGSRLLRPKNDQALLVEKHPTQVFPKEKKIQQISPYVPNEYPSNSTSKNDFPKK